jgi:CRISPR/Cas system Type II protein with McrA/HNH and RuvC-like nuclease domain
LKEVINVAKDPYGRRFYAAKKRKAFEKLKRTDAFKAWRERQLKVQEGLCAYCRIPLKYRDIVVHVDHIQPLHYEGTNDLSNLVLTCRRCNLRKWVKNNYVQPAWVKQNEEAQRRQEGVEELRQVQAKQMEALVSEEMDEQVYNHINEWA